MKGRSGRSYARPDQLYRPQAFHGGLGGATADERNTTGESVCSSGATEAALCKLKQRYASPEKLALPAGHNAVDGSSLRARSWCQRTIAAYAPMNGLLRPTGDCESNAERRHLIVKFRGRPGKPLLETRSATTTAGCRSMPRPRGSGDGGPGLHRT
jgi:hypothetical protein